MAPLIKFLLLIVRLVIIYKVCVILYYSSNNATDEQMKTLNWWIGFLVFDIWAQTVLPNNDLNKKDSE